MRRTSTRRDALLGVLGGGIALQPERKPGSLAQLQSVFVRYADPTTEALVIRLTDPSVSSLLPSVQNRFVSSKNRFLVFSTDRLGSYSPWILDLRGGVMRQLASPKSLDTTSLSLDGREHLLYYLDGNELREVVLVNGRNRLLIEGVTAFRLDIASGLFVVQRGSKLFRGFGSENNLLAEAVETLGPIQPQVGGCLFGRKGPSGEQQFWYAADRAKPVMLAAGEISSPVWSVDGASLYYLRTRREESVLVELWAVSPDSSAERRISATTQLAIFSANADGSVLVGASRSKAQPNILLVLRSVARELTLCEHRAKDPSRAEPVFSPNSQRVYFQSDRDGKAAIYSVNVERLIESTA